MKEKKNQHICRRKFKFPLHYYKVFKAIEYNQTIESTLEKIGDKNKIILYQLLYLLYEIEFITFAK